MTDEQSKPSEQSESEAKAEKSSDKPEGKKGGSASLVGVVGFLATLAIGFFAGRELDKSYHIGERVRSIFTGGPTVNAEDDERYRADLRGDEPQLGPDDALITIVEYSDFQCPYCAKAAPVVKQIVDSYEGDVRVIFKQYPLPGHPKAIPAGKAAYAAHKQGKFWEFHDHLFDNKANTQGIEKFAADQGLDVEQFKKDMASKEVADWVDNDHASGGKAGTSGTPYFLVNGRPFSGARPITHWEAIVEQELDYANSLGVDRAKVYETIMKDAKAVRAGGQGVGGAPSKRAQRPGAPDPSKVYAVPPGEGRPQMGPSDALVTIIEYSDFQCPFCEKVLPTIEQIKQTYPNDVRVIFRQRPLGMHPQARPAAQAALAAHRQGKFWEMHDLLFQNRKLLSTAKFEELAQQLGLDMATFRTDYEDPAIAQMIREDEQVATNFGAGGTPAFFINGRFLSGARPFESFQAIIDEEKAKAQALVDAGTPRSQVLAKLYEGAETSVPKPKPVNPGTGVKPGG